MTKYKVIATMDVGYVAEIEAENVEKAWEIAKNGDGDWVKADTGHDWTVESIVEVKDYLNDELRDGLLKHLAMKIEEDKNDYI
jgi:deoxyribose-phosphate aldolase